MYSITSRWGHQNAISVMWNIGKLCNYDCSYCPAEIHDLTSKSTEYQYLTRTVDELSALHKPVRIMFTGGEPTLHPQFGDLLKYIQEQNVSWVSVTTNGTKSVTWYKTHEQYWNHLLFSLHFEFNWQRVVDVITDYKKHTTKPFFVNIMAHHNYMTEVKHVVTLFTTLGIKYAIRRIRWVDNSRDEFDDNKYTEDDLSWLLLQDSTADANCLINDSTLMHSNDVIKHHLNKFTRWTCNAGLESLMINWDGLVYRATCRVGNDLGNIYTGTFNRPTTPICCTRDWCTCAADIYITKVNTNILHGG